MSLIACKHYPSGARYSQEGVRALGAARSQRDQASESNEVRGTVCALRLPVLECSTWENCSSLDWLCNPIRPRAREMA
jgi:hypothetical protein